MKRQNLKEKQSTKERFICNGGDEGRLTGMGTFELDFVRMDRF